MATSVGASRRDPSRPVSRGCDRVADMTLLHLALASDWARAQVTGRYDMSTLGRTIESEGFLHASSSRAQAEGVAGRFYSGVTEPLLLLTIAEEDLPAHGLVVRLEPAVAGDPTSELFPHVYGGCLPLAAVREVTPFPGSD